MDSNSYREHVVPTSCGHVYGKTCGVPYAFSATWDLHTVAEYVRSYRGPPKYVQVGSKKRRAFNAFERHKRVITPASQVQFSCPSAYDKTWSVNHATSYFLSRMPEYPNPTNFYVSSGACPFLTPGSMANFSNELLEYVKRDAFIKLKQPDFDGLVFVAELQETLHELRRILMTSVKALARTGSKRKSSNLRSLILKPDEWWLWYRYFLLPAMMDAEAVIKVIKGIATVDRVQDGDRLVDQRTSDTSYVKMGQRDYSYPCQWETEWKFGAGAALDVISRFDPSPWGFTPVDVTRAVWERIPWSFVADWFINVGDWLATLREVEFELAQSYASFALECETKVTFTGWYESKWVACEPVTYKTLQIMRYVDIEPPPGPLVDLKWNSIIHTIDAISLVVGMFRNISVTNLRRK